MTGLGPAAGADAGGTAAATSSPSPVVPLPAGRRMFLGSAVVLTRLAVQELRRIVLHPISLAGWGLLAFEVVQTFVRDEGPRVAFTTIDSLLTFDPGVMLILVGNLVASRDRRAGSEELLASLPSGPVLRTLALQVAAVATAVIGLVVVLAIHVVHLLLGRYEQAPSAWHLLQAPVTLAGAVLLGVLVARWFRARTAAAVVIAAVVVGNIAVHAVEDGEYFGPMMSWARWGTYPENWAGTVPGSVGWHVGYLVGLCAMAALGALLVVARRRVPVLLGGLAAVGFTVLCGWAQLP